VGEGVVVRVAAQGVERAAATVEMEGARQLAGLAAVMGVAGREAVVRAAVMGADSRNLGHLGVVRADGGPTLCGSKRRGLVAAAEWVGQPRGRGACAGRQRASASWGAARAGRPLHEPAAARTDCCR